MKKGVMSQLREDKASYSVRKLIGSFKARLYWGLLNLLISWTGSFISGRTLFSGLINSSVLLLEQSYQMQPFGMIVIFLQIN